MGWFKAHQTLERERLSNPGLTLEDLIRRTINRVEEERSLHVHVEAEPIVDILTETLGKLRSSLEELESFDSEQEQIGTEQVLGYRVGRKKSTKRCAGTAATCRYVEYGTQER